LLSILTKIYILFKRKKLHNTSIVKLELITCHDIRRASNRMSKKAKKSTFGINFIEFYE